MDGIKYVSEKRNNNRWCICNAKTGEYFYGSSTYRGARRFDIEYSVAKSGTFGDHLNVFDINDWIKWYYEEEIKKLCT